MDIFVRCRTIIVQKHYLCIVQITFTMATISFLYRSTKPKAFLNLRLLFRHNNKDFVYGAKIKVEVSKEYWNKHHKSQRIKNIDTKNTQTEIIKELNKIENHILKAFNSVSTIITNKDWLKAQINYYYNPPHKENNVPKDLINFIDYYIEKRKGEIKPASIVKYQVIKHKMERLQASRREQILIKDIDEDFKEEFVRYYKTESYSQNTTQRELGIIKTFCRYAKTKGIETSLQLDGLKLKKEKVEKIYLSFEEIEKIENVNNLSEHLINAKDWLIISCYTGQRISDFMRFNAEMIRIEKGKPLIEFTQMKTGKLMTVPLHKKVLEILEMRNGNFPRAISDQKYNDYIKIVCKEANLKELISGKKQDNITPKEETSKMRSVSGTYEKWELVTSHIGRRSFSTNYYGKIPTTYLIYVTGHSTETMFLNYIGKSNKDLALELINYF